MGELQTIFLKRVRRGPMDCVSNARLVAGKGLSGNADAGGKRQVTLISEESWNDVMAALEGSLGLEQLDISARRANLVVSGLDLRASRGRILRVGDCRVHVHGETVPCLAMEERFPGLQEALRPEWRGGVYGEVLDDGQIYAGDEVVWDDEAQ